MKYLRISLVTIKSLNLLFGNLDKDKDKLVKRHNKDEIRTFFKKMIFMICFKEFLLVISHKYLYCTLAMSYEFTLPLFLLQNIL